MPLLEKMFKDNLNGCTWLLDYFLKHDLCSLLLENSNGEAREQFGTLFKTALIQEQSLIKEK